MDAINLDILKQLQEYAQMYFDAIVEANSECGKCKFANGKYTAKDVTKWIYALPCDDIFNEDIILESGTFKCKFPYRRIFEVLSDWETMCRAGKLKTLFEIGEDEVKSAKVLTQEKTVLGAFKTKSMKLQHIGGNWWGLPKEIRKGNAITGYYELNGVMFAPGKTFWGDVASAGNQEFCKNRDDADIIKLIKSYIGQHCSENPYCEYITEVARLAGISNKPDQAATPTDTPQIVRVEIVRDFDKSYYANLYDENGDGHNLSKEYTDFRTLETLCKKEYGVNLPNLSQIEFEKHGRKSYAYISTETPQISTETAETVNVSAEEGKREYYREYRLTNDIPLFSGDPEITEQKWLIGFIHSYGNFRVEVAYIFMRNGKLYEDIMYLTKEQFRAKYGQFLPSVNVSAEGEKEAERAKYRVSRLGDYKIIVGDRVQSKVIAVLMSVNGHNTIEINDESAHIATMGEKPLQIDKPIMQLSDAEVLELIYGSIRLPQLPERKIKFFHYTPEQLKRYIIDVYEKYANGEWVLQPHEQIDTDAGLWDVVGGKIGYWTNWRREKFSEVNMDFNSPTCHACYKINRTYQKDDFIVSNEKLLEFTIGGNYYYIQKQTYSKGKHRWCYTIMDAHGDFAVNDFSYTKRGILQRFNKWWKKNATIIWRSSEFAPQSPEAPQVMECSTEPCKLAQTA